MPVLRSTYQALREDYRKAIGDRDDAVKLAASRLFLISRQAEEIARLRDERPEDGPLPQPRPVTGDAELRRRLHLTERALAETQQRLEALQTSHIADTRELHDLRQGATS
ncbi:hypothetical protein ACWDE0_21850 [Streptomyces sp. 900105755]